MREAAGGETIRVIHRAGALRTQATSPLVEPDVVVCGWCAHFGRPHVHARAMTSRRWRAMPHAEALAHARIGRASHGLCPACLPQAVKEWDAESADEPAAPMTGDRQRRHLSAAPR